MGLPAGCCNRGHVWHLQASARSHDCLETFEADWFQAAEHESNLLVHKLIHVVISDTLKSQYAREHYLPNKASKDLRHVWIISSRLGNGDTQLSVTHGTQSTDPSSTNPDDERQPHRARMLQHTLGGDEYSWANDVSWGDNGTRG